MRIITLLTDFGSRDGFAGVMKGVILGIAPDVQIVDLSHEIPPQDVMQGALLLRRVATYFPDGTIHIGVIDPGVGTSRRGIAAQLGLQLFIGPDNGLFSFILKDNDRKNLPGIIVNLDKPKYWLADVYTTFHGRDIFSPVAAHLANGVPLNAVGTPIDDPVLIEMPQPTPSAHGWSGQVIHVDHFGNLSTNLTADQVNLSQHVSIRIKDVTIYGVSSTFGGSAIGSLVALVDSSGSIALCVVNGSAEKLLNAVVGDKVEAFLY